MVYYEPIEWDCDNCGAPNEGHFNEGPPTCTTCGFEDDWWEMGVLENYEDEYSDHDPYYDFSGYGYGEDYLIDGVGFADPGGRSALRAATRDNPRDQPCPTCGEEDVLTHIDVRRGYQCNRCADKAEGLIPDAWY